MSSDGGTGGVPWRGRGGGGVGVGADGPGSPFLAGRDRPAGTVVQPSDGGIEDEKGAGEGGGGKRPRECVP